MKFKQIDKLKRLITVHVPSEGDGFNKQKMGVVYKLLPQNEITELIEAGDDDATLERIFVGQYDNKFENGDVIEDTPDNLAMFVDVSYIRSAIISEYFRMFAGGRQKN